MANMLRWDNYSMKELEAITEALTMNLKLPYNEKYEN